jgi:hypothetical protein
MVSRGQSENRKARREDSHCHDDMVLAPKKMASPKALGFGVDAAQAVFDGLDYPLRRDEAIRMLCSSLSQGAPVVAVEKAIEAMVASRRLVQDQEVFASQLRSRSGRSFPAGRESPRYQTPQAARRNEALRRIVGFARDLDVSSKPDGTFFAATKARAGCDPGLFIARFPEVDLIQAYEVLSGLALIASHAGRFVLGIAPSLRGAAHLEATTGVQSVAAERVRSLPANSLIIVDKANRISPRMLRGVISAAACSSASVVFVPSPNSGQSRVIERSGPTLHRNEGGPDASGVRLPVGSQCLVEARCGGVRVILRRALADVIETLRAERNAISESGDHAVIVTADRPFAHLIGEGAIVTSELRTVLGEFPGTKLVVLGGARVLGGYLDGLLDEQRVHVALMSSGDGREESALMMEIAEPQAFRQAHGRWPTDIEGKRAWRTGLLLDATGSHLGEAPRGLASLEWTRRRRAVPHLVGRNGAELR